MQFSLSTDLLLMGRICTSGTICTNVFKSTCLSHLSSLSYQCVRSSFVCLIIALINQFYNEYEMKVSVINKLQSVINKYVEWHVQTFVWAFLSVLYSTEANNCDIDTVNLIIVAFCYRAISKYVTTRYEWRLLNVYEDNNWHVKLPYA